MPRLTDAQRDSINRRSAATDEVRKRNRALPQYYSQHCNFCNWASNGQTIDEVIAANSQHIQEQHAADMAIIEANRLELNEIPASLHDHECEKALCRCKCGCDAGPFCILVGGPLCSVCQVREGRGDDDHGV